MSLSSLPPVPATPFRALDHTANQGMWEGGLHEVRWGYPKGWLRSQVRRALLRRRSFQLTLAGDEAVLVASIRDEGTIGAVHAVLFDRKTGATLATAGGSGRPLSDLAVGPYSGEGTDAWLRTAAAELVLSRRPGDSAWTLAGRLGDLVLDVALDTAGAPPAVTAIGEPKRRRPGLSSRWNLLTARGTAAISGRSFDLGGLGSMAYTNTFLVPGSRWFELTGMGRLPDGRRIGIGLTDGPRHGDVHEHVLFLDEARDGVDPSVSQLPRARIVVGGVIARDTWRVRSPHGDCELKFRPLGADIEDVSRPYRPMQVERVFGTFSGRIPLPDGKEAIVDGLPGLAESHRPG